MKFRYIKNHVANAATAIADPWERQWPYPALLVEKAAWRQWCADPNTEHCFFSCAEGVAPDLRISDDNPIYSASGLVVDFDSYLGPTDAVEKFSRKYGEFRPAWVCQTFSENARAGWDFERPVLFAGPKHYAGFADAAMKALKLDKIHGGFEPTALRDCAKYYDVGRQRWMLAGETIPKSVLEQWSLDATRKMAMAPQELKVPLEAVAAEVERRWPGAWRGSFTKGARGKRFWDPSVDNETAAVVCEEGMLCFTGNQPFVTWREILGAPFCRQFEAKQLADLTANVYYDSKQMWTKENGVWHPTDKADFSQKLRVMGFDASKARGKTHSQIDEIEMHIKTVNRVDAAVPFVYRQDGPLMWNNMRFLNTARAKCMEPMPEPVRKLNPTFADLEEHCGRLIYPYFKHLFANTIPGDPSGENIQLWHLLRWIQLCYVSGYRQTPKRKQMLALAGKQSVGKTFLIQAILTPLLGGCATGDYFLTGQTNWSSDLIHSPLIAMDDGASASGDQRDLIKFTQRLKAIVASGEMMFARKFGAELRIEWLGALILACNRDPHSLVRSLPDMDLSIRNKLILLLTNDVPFPGFRTLEENKAILADELIWFASWLMEWQPPSCTDEVNEKRFGMNAYHHPELMRDLSSQGFDEVTWSVICSMIDEREKNFKTAKDTTRDPRLYKASLVQLHMELVATNPAYMRDLKVQVLQRCLQSLARKSRPVSREIDSQGKEVWSIDLRESK